MSTQGPTEEAKILAENLRDSLKYTEEEKSKAIELLSEEEIPAGLSELKQAHRAFELLYLLYEAFMQAYDTDKNSPTTQKTFERLLRQYKECRLIHHKNITDTDAAPLSSFKKMLAIKYGKVPNLPSVLKAYYNDKSENSNKNLSKLDDVEKLIAPELKKQQFNRLNTRLIRSEETYIQNLKEIRENKDYTLSGIKRFAVKEPSQEEMNTVKEMLNILPAIEEASSKLKDKFKAFQEAAAKTDDFERNKDLVKIANEIEVLYSDADRHYSAYIQHFNNVNHILPEDLNQLKGLFQAARWYHEHGKELKNMIEFAPKGIKEVIEHMHAVSITQSADLNLYLADLQEDLNDEKNSLDAIINNDTKAKQDYEKYLEKTEALDKIVDKKARHTEMVKAVKALGEENPKFKGVGTKRLLTRIKSIEKNMDKIRGIEENLKNLKENISLQSEQLAKATEQKPKVSEPDLQVTEPKPEAQPAAPAQSPIPPPPSTEPPPLPPGTKKAPPKDINELKARMRYETINITKYNKEGGERPNFKNKGTTLFVLQDNTIDMKLYEDKEKLEWKNRIGHGGMADAKYMGANKILDKEGNPMKDPFDGSPLYDVYAVGVPTVAKKEKGKSWWEPRPTLTTTDIDKGFANLYKEFASGRYDNVCVPTWGVDGWGKPLPAFTGGGSADKLPPELQEHMFKRFQELKVFCNAKSFKVIPDEFKDAFRSGLPDDTFKAAFDEEVKVKQAAEVKPAQDAGVVPTHFEKQPPPRPTTHPPETPRRVLVGNQFQIIKDQAKEQAKKDLQVKDTPEIPNPKGTSKKTF